MPGGPFSEFHRKNKELLLKGGQQIFEGTLPINGGASEFLFSTATFQNPDGSIGGPLSAPSST